jgi:transposase
LTLPVCDPLTGEVRNVEIFVGILGTSRYPFARAVPSQGKKEFFAVHNAMFEAFGGIPKFLVTNKHKFAIVKRGKNKGNIDPDYESFAAHNGCAVIPSLPLKSKDKPLVEGGIRFIQKCIFSKLNSQTFFSVTQLNKAIDELLVIYRNKVMKRYGQSRQEMFDTIDKPELGTLPLESYEHKELKLLKVGIDSHVSLARCFYSVPYRLVGKKVEVWCGIHTVTVIYNGKVVANHPNLTRKGAYSTEAEHMGSTYQIYHKWSPERILNWALVIGKDTRELLRHILERRPHPEMGYRSCLGIMREFIKQSDRGIKREKLDFIAKYAIIHHRFRLKQIVELLKGSIVAELEVQLT